MKSDNLIDFMAFINKRIVKDPAQKTSAEEFRIAIQILIQRLKNHDFIAKIEN